MSNAGPTGPLISSTVVADIQHGRTTRWLHTALRTRTLHLRDILARALGYSSASDLRTALLSGDTPQLPAVEVAATLGTIWAAAASGQEDARAGQRLLRAVASNSPDTLSVKQQQIYAQISFILGETEDVTGALDLFPAIPSVVAESLRTDLLNPRVAGHWRAEWCERLALPFRAAGVAPITVAPQGETLFDGLQCAALPDTDGPLVSVIMPCYRPDAGLLTSIRSITAQSHVNLEVILIDDASGPDFADLFDEATAFDPRVKLLRMEQNGGTYRCRNAALEIARGVYVTVQDADDWSHPARLAAQVRLLEENPFASGSRSDAIRATDDLTHQWVGYAPRRRNASSLMFRRTTVETVGAFDLVRKSGDSEFIERLTRVVGPVLDTSTPLAVTRLRSGTLSRGDFTYQWMHPDRLSYRASFRSWHRTLGTGPVQPTTATGERAFPAPKSMLRGLPGERRRDTDPELLLVLDGSDADQVAEAIGLAGVVDRVGVVHVEDPTRGRSERPEPSDALMAAVRAGRLHLLSAAEHLEARTGVVLCSGILELPASPALRLRVDTLAVVARRRNIEDHLTVIDTSRAIAGRGPTWVAANGADQLAWALDGWDLPLVSELVQPVVSTDRGAGPS